MDSKIKVAAYARVSTLLNQDPQNQLFGIRKFSIDRGFSIVGEYTDFASGTKEVRPELSRLIRDARMGKFKILIVHAIDRLGRSTKHLLNLLDELNHYGVSFISIREQLDFSSPTGKMALTMLSAVSQLERQLISERIKTALAVKKMVAQRNGSNWRCGRPSIQAHLKDKVLELRERGLSIRGISRFLNGEISKSSVERIIKESK